MPARIIGATLAALNRLLGTSFTTAPGVVGTGAIALSASPTFTGTMQLVNATSTGTYAFSTAPGTAWAFDGDSATLTVGNAANVALAAGSGLVMCINPADGSFGMYFAGGANVNLITSTGTWVTPTTTPAAGKACIQWDGSTAYRLYNNYGSSQAFKVTLLRVRASV